MAAGAGRVYAALETPAGPTRILAVSAVDGRVDRGFAIRRTTDRDHDSSADAAQMEVAGSRLYVLTSLGDVLEAFDARSGRRLWALGPRFGSVNVIATAAGKLYLGGTFESLTGIGGESIGGRGVRYVTAVDAASGRVVRGWRARLNGFVDDLAVHGSRVYMGGDFTRVDGRQRRGAVALRTADGSVDWGWRPGIQSSSLSNGDVNGVAAAGGRVYLTGDFVLNGRYPLQPVAADARTGAPRRLYVGGKFEQIAGRPRKHLAALGPATGSPVAGFEPQLDAACGERDLRARQASPPPTPYCRPASELVLLGRRLIAGGLEGTAGADDGRLSVLDARTGRRLRGLPAFHWERGVTALAAVGRGLYIGQQRRFWDSSVRARALP